MVLLLLLQERLHRWEPLNCRHVCLVNLHISPGSERCMVDGWCSINISWINIKLWNGEGSILGRESKLHGRATAGNGGWNTEPHSSRNHYHRRLSWWPQADISVHSPPCFLPEYHRALASYTHIPHFQSLLTLKFKLPISVLSSPPLSHFKNTPETIHLNDKLPHIFSKAFLSLF